MQIHWQSPLPSGPKLIAANHPSCTDPFIISLLSRKPISIMITGKAFTVPLFQDILHRSGQIPVIPGNGKQALEHARQRLELGGAVAIFPEGHISPQGGGHLPPRSGAVKLAMLTGAPIVPVGIYYPRERSIYITSKITGGEKTEGYWYLRGPCSITVGEPMFFMGNAENKTQIRDASTCLMERIAYLAEESQRRMLHMPITAFLTPG
jgi:1-acyl-sn-glycerol-3-phosphate acyltransferase